jgi:hypothetical protein
LQLRNLFITYVLECTYRCCMRKDLSIKQLTLFSSFRPAPITLSSLLVTERTPKPRKTSGL